MEVYGWSGLAAFVLVVAVLLFTGLGCTAPPKGIEPVAGFEAKRYTGTWYEIARLDNRFEKGLSNVTATYTLRDGGQIGVKNRGYDDTKGQWREIEGTARFRKARDVGSLEVIFFWPFYGGYHIILLDKDYQYALVCGQTRSYLWILARSPMLDTATTERLIDFARKKGFATDRLLFIAHDRQE